ncbi:hypothetical protein [Candidatus Enterococcus ikei]|uniref:Phage protein n=1 Tax=Candidatus Enterococcus ikei TaxID=2815326 RepID=A0ABS3GUX6_9ENTE|nr:hypothetical protein [Enterococcus sp. DIV0869a]MBO0438955.1 hypothetical protein [Enterococcus sp. DIV0869a]
MEEQIQIVELSENSIKKIAKEVYKLDKKERDKARKEFKNRSLHNTKKLLENYHKLKEHTAGVREQIDESAEQSIWYNGYLTVDSLMKNRAKTVKMMGHVDNSLDKYQKICNGENKKSKARRCDILIDFYINRISIDLIADRYDVDRTTIIRNKDDAIDDLSILLFGIDIFNEL